MTKPKSGDDRPLLLRGLPRKHYRCILVDPPWNFRSYARSANPKSDRGVERHYQTMKMADLEALPIADLAHPDGCHLFLWVTGPMIPAAVALIDAWRFKFSSLQHTWIKLKRSYDPMQLRVLPTADGDFHVGLGFTSRKNTELMFLARRGNAKRIAKNVRELIIAPVREHSRKPDEAHERIERYCDGPRLELFGRQKRAGWTVRGDEVGKFGAA
jgi:N6-adenosine-specific RNA methylase IME4